MINARRSPTRPPGDGKSLKALLLEKGAQWLQDTAPLKQFDVYVVGFHCAKEHPEQQMEAHHYCRQVNGEFLQCVLFDGNTEDANLVGIEYIISERLFQTLPPEEQAYWHPHNYEVLSGELVAPGIPETAEKAQMGLLINSYGKTWHTWHTGRHDTQRADGNALPLGPPHLMWSFNRYEEADSAMQTSRNRGLEIDVMAKRRQRADLAAQAHPQRGVNALKDAFPHAHARPPGVRDVDEPTDD